ncbi:serine hydrolase [Chryseobacterium sp. Tr-659]|uniref:serine hydrolase n=1 Tax=Chryseobacterium sp. Tr-659 TaxID=2608340 RepID=UPI0014231911|nr:serine hydrolase [Chryseobacterium sp. Tr-659]NIF04659.1 serine hydrolase [Chryseobacterium sp. Tr-659]
MKNVLLLVFALAFVKYYAQNDQKVYSIIDANAQKLAQKSGAYSVSVGILKDGKVYTRHFGEIDKGKGNKADDNTYFEIASVTKLFTGQLLAKAVLEGKINLDDDVRKYLKGSYPNLEYNGTPIRVRNLISYQTALPRNLPNDDELRKNMSDETPFLYNKLNENYTKENFKRDLAAVKLDALPGTKYRYSNLSLEVAGLMLENIYGKDYEVLLKENIFSKLGMDHTKFNLDKNEAQANGYHINYRLMPASQSELWGSGGAKTKSTMGDMVKFLKEELDSQNKIAKESQRNIDNSKEAWYGYFWNKYFINEKGKTGFKHGGSYGTNTWFAVYPELNIGVCMIVNINGPETFGILYNTAADLVGDLISTSDKKDVYGYSVKGDKVVFSYTHPENLNADLINNIAVAGSFNDWNPNDKEYQMVKKGKSYFEVAVPVSKFEKGKAYSFKFVFNKEGWMTSPKNASNTDRTENNSLVLTL